LLQKIYTACWAILLCCCACTNDDIAPAEQDLASGGETTVYGEYVTIFEQPAANLSAAEIEQHRLSDLAFGDQFVTSPALINAGLGPLFNQNSCESCHVSNGRSPFPNQGGDLRGLLIRLSTPGHDMHGGAVPVNGYGTQLQTKAVFGKSFEAALTWTEEIQTITYPDGEQVVLSKPVFQFDQMHLPMGADVMYSARMATPIIGLGLLEAIDEEAILALADALDEDGDGISGKPNLVWDVANQQTAIGRFGWKAGNPTLLQQTAGAYNQDMGVTNPLFPIENCDGQIQCDTLTDDPEIDMDVLRTATFYSQSLGVPGRRNADDPAVRNGKVFFNTLNCSACHQPAFTTGQHEFSFLSHQQIHPYTDLLLHDMGEGLADGRSEFEANGNEWRTPPLWGIGLTYTVGGHTRFLHDGRARSLEEAILWHGGEAQSSKEQFMQLTKKEREELIDFLESL
jgi:CxxC motif-containing protein (DUF1111 family)